MATNGSIEFKQQPLPEFENRQQKDIVLRESRTCDTENIQVPSTNSILFNIQELTTYILQFLSTASNETLGACVVGLGAITYLVLGRIGLILIGVVAGVVLHATWEDNLHNNANNEIKLSEVKIRHERGLAIIERVLDWREHTNSHKDEENNGASITNIKQKFSTGLDFSSFQPATSAALINLTDAVIRDHVKYGTYEFLSKAMLTFLGGGTIQSCPSNHHFPLLASKASPVSSSPFLHIFHERDPRMHFSIF